MLAATLADRTSYYSLRAGTALSHPADPLTMTIEEFTDYIRKDIEKWRKVVKRANLTFDR